MKSRPGQSRTTLVTRLNVGLCVLVALAQSANAQQYTVTDLGTLLGHDFSMASGINTSGQVAGTSAASHDTEDEVDRAFLWSGGVMSSLRTLPGYDSSAASGINDSGQVVGYSSFTSCDYLWDPPLCDLVIHAFLWSNGVMSDLGTLPGHDRSTASGINGFGQVVGYSGSPAFGISRAFLWDNGVMNNLGTLPGHTGATASGINDFSQVVGTSYGSGYRRAFLWSDGVMMDLGTLPGDISSVASGINVYGQVVGYSYATDLGHYHAFLWSDGVMMDLGTLPGYDVSFALGINASRQVVGNSSPFRGATHAFLWSNGVMTDLNNLIPPNSGWVLASATAINDAGQIVGSGTINGQTHAFLLTPQ